LLKLERSKVDAVLGMDRALASHALPTADRDVDIKRVDLGIRWFSTTYPGFSEPSSVLQCARKFLWDQDR
jgi:hypothetical protein